MLSLAVARTKIAPEQHFITGQEAEERGLVVHRTHWSFKNVKIGTSLITTSKF